VSLIECLLIYSIGNLRLCCWVEWKSPNKVFNGRRRGGATTISITTLNIKGLYVTISISDTQHNNIVIMLGVVMLSVAFYLLPCWVSLCWMSLCWVSLCWMSLCWVSLCWMSLCWVSLCWMSLCWMSWRRRGGWHDVDSDWWKDPTAPLPIAPYTLLINH
jgi:hypothetical protein